MLDLDYMAFLVLPTLHNWFLRHVRSGTPLIVKLQKMHPSPLDKLCTVCAALGNEFCFLLLLPVMAWNVDMTLGRKMILLWGIGFYISNYLKDLLLLPRPYHINEDVRNLMPNTSRSRHGLPCTRTFTATVLPFYLLFSTHQLYGYSFTWGLGLAVSWCLLVSLSRIYLGLHSPVDVIAGMILGLMFVSLWLAVGDQVDHVVTTGGWWLPLAEPVMTWLLLAAYPNPPTSNCSPAFPETALVAGFTTGCSLGSAWFLQAWLRVPQQPGQPPHGSLCLTNECLWLMGIRSVVGLSVLAATYVCSIRFFLECFRLRGGERDSKQGHNSSSGKGKALGGPSSSSSSSSRAMMKYPLLRTWSHGSNTTTTSSSHHHQPNGDGYFRGGTSRSNGHHHHSHHGNGTAATMTMTNGDHHGGGKRQQGGGGSIGGGMSKKGHHHHHAMNGSNGGGAASLSSMQSSSSSTSAYALKHQQHDAPMLTLWSLGLLTNENEDAVLSQYGGYEVLVPVLYCASLCVGFNTAFVVPLLMRFTGLLLLLSPSASSMATLA